MAARRPLVGARPSAAALLLVVSAVGLVIGGVARGLSSPHLANDVWAGVSSAGLIASVSWAAGALRRRSFGVDVIAVTALAGALAVGQYLAGAVIAAMLGTGRSLEDWASRRSRRELTALLEMVPRIAHRVTDGTDVDVEVSVVSSGDVLIVRSGEVVPVDGVVSRGIAVLDESRLTGEPVPVDHATGDAIRSGSVNVGQNFEVTATRPAVDSTYASIVEMVRAAQASTAPFVRLADRYAAWFVPLVFVAAAAAWATSGSAVRAVAVLVVATPCPLILAAPTAIAGGLSALARRGIVVRNGSALERLALAQTLLVDKTGTLTVGHPDLVEIISDEDSAALLQRVASLDRYSAHPLASAIVTAATSRGLMLFPAYDVEEVAGQGICGIVDGRRVRIGKATWSCVDETATVVLRARRRAAITGAVTVFVSDDDTAGALLLADRIRPEAARALRSSRRAGIKRVVIVTGDREDVGRGIGDAVAADAVYGDMAPDDKLRVVQQETASAPTAMLGDGVNDAPALAVATVGIAIADNRAGAAAEAADVIVVAPRVDRVGEAFAISRRTRRIALQSATAGMSLSLVAMVVAGFGALVPVLGAVVQELIDAAVVANALRAISPGSTTAARLAGEDAGDALRFSAEHPLLRAGVERLRELADQLEALPMQRVDAELTSSYRFLVDELLPHEEAEERRLYPTVARSLGGEDPTATMSRAHVEIARLTRQLGHLVSEGVRPDELREARRILYGLYAVLCLHFAQEEENYFVLADESQ